mgnify:CR=1 FL=1
MICLTFSYMFNQKYYIIKILCNLLYTPFSYMYNQEYYNIIILCNLLCTRSVILYLIVACYTCDFNRIWKEYYKLIRYGFHRLPIYNSNRIINAERSVMIFVCIYHNIVTK